MIKKIVIKNVASFDNEGVTLDDLKKVNFIYGGNACGKTTISRVLSCKDIQHSFPQCNVEWEGDPLQVVTYNYCCPLKVSEQRDIHPQCCCNGIADDFSEGKPLS